MSLRTPSYRLHKATGQAVVTLSDHDFYLGPHGTPESEAEYNRLIAEWLLNGRRLPARNGSAPIDLTVAELALAYIKHADAYYQKHGRPTGEATNIRYAIRKLRDLYGHTAARDYGPLALKATRQAIVDSGVCRNEANRRTRIIVRMFKWGVSEEMIPPAVYQGLMTVPGLRKGRTNARESKPVRPVADAVVDAVKPHVSAQVRTMIDLQKLSGMRPGEVVIMRTIDLDTSGPVWVYTPPSHKTEHADRERKVYIGPAAQAVLKPWLRTELTAFLFSPLEATEAKNNERRRNRKSRMTPSHKVRGRKKRPKKTPGDVFTVDSYRRAIEYGCRQAFPHPKVAELSAAMGRPALAPGERQRLREELKAWIAEHRAELKEWDREHRFHPNQLRHACATRLRRQYGLDVARVVLGHSHADTTLDYAEIDEGKAIDAMQRVG